MKEVCFKIENCLLYLDEVLVEFNMPIFFVCESEDNKKYVALCTDADELTYLVFETEISFLLEMLDSKVTLRDFVLQAGRHWRVFAQGDYRDDIVERANGVLNDELPVAGTYFELSNSKIEQYKERLREEKGNIVKVWSGTHIIEPTVFRKSVPFSWLPNKSSTDKGYIIVPCVDSGWVFSHVLGNVGYKKEYDTEGQ